MKKRFAVLLSILAIALSFPSVALAWNEDWNDNCTSGTDKFIWRGYDDDSGNTQLNAWCIQGAPATSNYQEFSSGDINKIESFNVTHFGSSTNRFCIELWDHTTQGGSNVLLYGNYWDFTGSTYARVDIPSGVDNQTNAIWWSTNSGCIATGP